MKLRTGFLLAISTAAVACTTTIDLQYAAPPPGNDFAGAQKLADGGYEYVELSGTYLKIAPAETSAPSPQIQKPPAVAANSSGPANNGNPAASSAPKRKTAVASTKDSEPAGSSAPPAASSAPGPNNPPAPGPMDASLATTLIDGQKWTATVVPIPESRYGFLVHGVSGFWKVTTIGISRYDNSDVASSISVSAQNLVATRIGQFAGAAASIVETLGIFGVDGLKQVPATPLIPFSLPVPDARKAGDLNDGWTYSFVYDDPDSPPGTFSFSDFMSNVASKTVHFWPVAACRPATLTVISPANSPPQRKYQFNVVVASPEHLRLQPLPANGKLSPGTVCAASESSSSAPDPVQNVVDALTALQQGVQKVNTAVSSAPGAAAKAPAKSSAPSSPGN